MYVLLGTRVCYAVFVPYCLEHNSGPKHSPLGILQENCMSETGPSLNHFPQQIFKEKGKITTRTCSAASVSVTNAVGKVGKVQVVDIDCVDASCCIILMKNNSITPKLRSLEFVWPMGLIQLVQANQTAYLSLSLLSSLS